MTTKYTYTGYVPDESLQEAVPWWPTMEWQRHWTNPLLNLFCRVASRVTPWQWNYYWRQENGRRRLVLRPDR